LIVAPNLRKEIIMAEKTAKTSTKTTAKKAAPKAVAAPSKAAAKAPPPKVTKPAAAKKTTVTSKPAAVKPAAAKPSAKTAKKAMIVSDEQRYRMIAEAAYYRAESNQFKSDSVRDWIEAESDIAALLSGSK